MNEELKHCPFCGGTVCISFHGSKSSGYWWSINRGLDKNTKCTCRLLMESDKFDCFDNDRREEEYRKLIDKWNKRYSDRKELKEQNNEE